MDHSKIFLNFDIFLFFNYDNFYLFQLSGIILLVAMIGSIVLTLRQRQGFKKQSIQSQITTEKSKAVEKKKTKIGEGVNV